MLLGLGLSACGEKTTDTSTADPNDTAISEPVSEPVSEPAMGLEYGVPWVDNDGDNWDVETDCDDNDPNTFPGSAELESDMDCMKDADGDGYGDENVQAPIVAGTDCDDSNPDVNPSAEDPSLNCSE